MGIKFPCPECGKVINVKDYLAGKRGFCPKCQAKVEIPLQTVAEPNPASSTAEPTIVYTPPELAQSLTENLVANTPRQEAEPSPSPGASAADAARARESVDTPSAAPAAAPGAATAAVGSGVPAAAAPSAPGSGDPLLDAPHLQWYVMPAGSQTPYGPATADIMRQWLAEGRVVAESLVWRQDWPQWVRAASALPQLRSLTPPPVGARMGVPVAAVAMAVPAAMPAASIVPANPQVPISSPSGESIVLPRRRARTGNLVVLLVLVAMIAALTPFVYKAITGRLVNPPPAKSDSEASLETPADSR